MAQVLKGQLRFTSEVTEVTSHGQNIFHIYWTNLMMFSPEVGFAASQILGGLFVVVVGLVCSPLFPQPFISVPPSLSQQRK